MTRRRLDLRQRVRPQTADRTNMGANVMVWPAGRKVHFVAWAAIALGIVSGQAAAFDAGQLGQAGSLLLGDIMPLIERSPALKREIATEAAKIGKKPEEIICGGMRFSGQWRHLSGYRVAPYVCGFGEQRFLEIRATVRLTSAGGKVFKKATPEAMKNASRIQETNPAWAWMTEDPRTKDRQ
ncbi:MAG: hypothetical protein ACK4UO_19960 [Pseudolabrys sp.]